MNSEIQLRFGNYTRTNTAVYVDENLVQLFKLFLDNGNAVS